MPMARTYTILASVGFLVGVAVGNWWVLPHFGAMLYFGVGLLTISLIFYKYRRWTMLVIWFLLFALLGNWRLGAAQIIPATDVSHYEGQIVTLQGVVIDDPQISIDGTKFSVQVKSLEETPIVSGKVLIKILHYPTYQYGNLISITGKLSLPSEDPADSYTKYLAKSGIYVICNYPEIQVVQDFVGNKVWRWLYSFKHYFLQTTNQVMPEPTAGLLAGLLLGISAALPKNLLDSFNATGLTHIIALSGFNISIVSGAILKLLRWLPLNFRLIIAIVAVWLFVLLTGAAPSAVRAALMGMLILLASLLGRLADISVSLCLTAIAMVAINPKILMGDIGFQLSFLATIGIIYLSPVLEGWLHRWPRYLSGLLGATLSALILVTPILMINFGRISFIAPLTNVLVVPLVPLAMLLGFWAVIGGMIQIDLGLVLGWIAWAPLKLVAVLAEYFRNLPGASIEVAVSGGWWVVIYYLVIVVGLIIYYGRQKPAPLRVVGDTSFR